MKIRVLLVDDHAVIRDTLRMILEMTSDIEVVGEVCTGKDVLVAVGKTSPDVVCMDINMPDMNGIDATRQLLAIYPNVKIIGLSAHTNHAPAAAIIDAGASSYISKEEAGSKLADAIRTVCTSPARLRPSLTRKDID